MTYKEIKDRLSKCETTLDQLKNGKVTNLKPAELRKKTTQLEVLRESYIKQLKEAQEKTYLVTPKSGKTAALSLGDDEVDALKDADDIEKIKSSDGNEVKENEGIKFSIEETKSIAKSVGKAVAMSLKALGDSVSSMKAKKIEESSFEIYVQYKNGADDQFSFYITEDTLHLVDFSFDKELTDVGVKPSGEAIVNVDVLANELQKHFKSLNETEMNEAPEGTYYIEVSVRDARKALAIIDDQPALKNAVEMNGSNVYYLTDESLAYDLMMDFGAQGIEVVDTNIEDEDDMLQEKEVEAPEGGIEQGGDLDVGHQDDEPNMLKKDLYDIITYASKLYKALDKYDQHDGEVDFPHWWQKKVTLAREYMSAAQHYLEGEEKQPAIDQLALESKVNEGRGDLQTIVGIIEDRAAESGFSVEDEAEEVIEAIQDHYKLNDVEENVDKLEEGTELYDRNGIQIKRFSGGERGLMVQITIGDKYIVVPAAEYPFLVRAMQSVQEDLKDMSRQYPRKKNMGEGIAKTQKAHGLVVAKMKELAKQYKAGDTSVIAQLKDLTAKKKQLEKQLEKDVAGKNRNQQLDTNIEEQPIQEEKATYCGRCKTTHKKSSGCPK
jgi:hypothetical protein